MKLISKAKAHGQLFCAIKGNHHTVMTFLHNEDDCSDSGNKHLEDGKKSSQNMFLHKTKGEDVLKSGKEENLFWLLN